MLNENEHRVLLIARKLSLAKETLVYTNIFRFALNAHDSHRGQQSQLGQLLANLDTLTDDAVLVWRMFFFGITAYNKQQVRNDEIKIDEATVRRIVASIDKVSI
jgi:hypothetical protein